jgi:hypothetical protein
MRRVIASCLFVAGFSLPATSIAEAATPHVGCPPVESGYQLWDVSTEPYQVDDFDFNGNGWLCAKPIDHRTFTLDGQTYQLYNFIDDVVPL